MPLMCDVPKTLLFVVNGGSPKSAEIPSMHPPRPLIHPRDEITQTMSRIYGYRMTTTSGGNLSIRDENGDIWISPARVDKGNLTRNDIVCVQADGTIVGLHPPSSEFPFHKAIYDARPDIRAIVHAHPVALVAFSICQATPNTKLFHQTHSVSGSVGFAPYACPGSEQLGTNIAATFAEGCDSVILENHGVVVGGDSLPCAFQRFEAFEFAGKTLIKAQQLGTVRYLDGEQLEIAHNRSVDLPTFEPDTAKPDERELRRQLCEFVRRGCRQRLLISTEGSFSARLDDDSFLITPTQKDREGLNIDDIVLVNGGQRELGKKASRAVLAHKAIYDSDPAIQAIVFAHPVNATAFSVTDVVFDTRTIPESYVFLLDVAHVPYGVQYLADGSIANFVSSKSPAAILENDGVVVAGKSILDAFDRLEVLEATAEAVINAGSVGTVSVMPDAVIAELRSAFNLG
ncbi:L-fuculose-phosphate aldolase [Rhodopirellula rubra]|uniref:L-fuculose-phosphate aldolase n=1 Tax=Aporhodopirellula rubra TaxID=980271 RepID=A0A7W5E3A9_9BACT|nr:L-fuculose-phosphate aldolase [Aporhodopirellula rubra]